MHPTADTTALMYIESVGAAGDAGRWAALGDSDSARIVEVVVLVYESPKRQKERERY